MAAVIRMPEVATGAAEAAIQSWLVSVGQPVAKGQTIVEIETEKAVVEYQAEEEGVLAGILLPEGAAGPVGVPIAVLAGPGESAAEALAAARSEGIPTDAAAGAGTAREAATPESTASADIPETPVPAPPTESSEDGLPPGPPPVAEAEADADADAAQRTEPASPRRLFASPLVRRLARERGIDLERVSGTGPHGRIVRRDIEAHTSAQQSPVEVDVAVSAPSPTPPAAPDAPPAAADARYEDTPHTGMRRAIARRLTESKSTVPHFYLTADCRVDDLLELRERINRSGDARVSVNDLVVKAVACALRDVPEANAIWTPEATRRFTGVDIAVAVSVPSGLLTPVVRDVDQLALRALSDRIKELASRAREGRLKQHELEGGSFSVSNLGMYGTQEFSAIINPPHAGILAVGAATRRPVVDGDELAIATVMTVTLSADHRVLDGAVAAQWLAAFVRRIENPLGLLI